MFTKESIGKVIILFTIILSFSLINVYSDENALGCCYNQDLGVNGYSPYYTNASCQSLGNSYFDASDSGCENTQLICACNQTWQNGYKFLAWTTNSINYPKQNTSIISSLLYSNYKCLAFCFDKTLTSNLNCQAPLSANEICGLSSGEGKYCCISANEQRGLTFDDQTTCKNNCEVVSGNYKILGVIQDTSNNPLTNVYVSATSIDISRTVITNSMGQYVIDNLKSGNYVVKASKSGYSENSSNLGLNGDVTNFKLTLNKAEETNVDCNGIDASSCSTKKSYSSCCNPACGVVNQLIPESSYSSSPNNQILCTNGLDNNCNGLNDLSESSCSEYVTTEPICNNHQIEGDEECDSQYYCNSQCKLIGGDCGDNIYNPILEVCDNSDPKHQINGCTNDCQIEVVNNQEQCQSNSDCQEGSNCINGQCLYPQEEEITPAQCITNSPTPSIKLKHIIANQNIIQIDNGQCNANFNLFRCTQTDDQQCTPTERITTMESLLYKDNDIKSNTTYCYKVKANYGTNSNSESDVQCITTGPKVCFKVTAVSDKICFDNKIQYCDINNMPTIETDCGDVDSTCINIDNNAQCIYQSQCDYCNIIYGTSPYDSFSMYTSRRTEDIVPTQCEQIKTCYKDYEVSSVDSWQACSDVNSCYDYKTSSACQENSCQNSEIGNCEWNYYNNSDSLGYGVCSPTDITKQNCSLCENEDGILKCNYDVCGLYGACYYDKVALQQYQCHSKFEIGCEDFESKKDCVNSNFRYSNTKLNSVQDILLNQSNNHILKPSNDYFAFEKCYWDSSTKKCFKDANDNGINDCSQKDNNFDDNDPIKLERCIKDSTAPTTSIDCPAITGKNININVVTSDDVDNNTFYNIVWKDSPYSKPNFKVINNKITTLDLINSDMTSNFKESGFYSLYYYSIDINNNPEEVKRCDMYIDNIAPTITINHNATITKQDYENNEFKSRLTLDIQVDDNYKGEQNQIKCNGYIKKGTITETMFVNKIFKPGKHFTKTYSDLPDNDYVITVNCTDFAGNNNQDVKIIKLNADDRISNINPVTNTYRGPITNISFETKFDGKCYIASISQDQDISTLSIGSMQEVTNKESLHNSGNYKYTYMHNFDTSGVYYYGIRCNFTFAGSKSYLTGSNSHKAMFAIDNTPPTISYSILDENGQDITELLRLNPDHILSTKAYLNISCFDPTIKTSSGNLMNFGSINFDNDNQGCRFTVNNTNTNSVFNSQSNTGQIIIEENTIYNIEANDGQNYNSILINAYDFDFDKAILNVDIKDSQGNSVNTLFPGTYDLIINSNKNLSLLESSKLIVDNGGSYDITSCDFTAPSSTIKCSFTIGNGVEIYSSAHLEISVKDSNDLTSNIIQSNSNNNINSLYVDTRKPSELEFAPEFNNQSIDPYYSNSNQDVLTLIQNNDNSKIYSNQDSLSLYGKTNQVSQSYMNVIRKNVFGSTNLYEKRNNQIELDLTNIGSNTITFTKDQIPFEINKTKNFIKIANLNGVNINRNEYPFYASYFNIININDADSYYMITLDKDITNACRNLGSCKFYITTWPLEYYNVFDKLKLNIGTNNYNYQVLKGTTLYSNKRNISINVDKSSPTIQVRNLARVTNQQQYTFTVTSSEDKSYDSGLDWSMISLNGDVIGYENIPESRINNNKYIDDIGLYLLNGWNNISIAVGDKVHNVNGVKYQIFYDPNALLVNDFSISNIDGDLAKKTDGSLYDNNAYLFNINNLNIIKNETVHRYTVEFSENVIVSNISILDQNDIKQNINNYDVNQNTVTFTIPDSMLKENINKIIINAGKKSNPMMIDYDLIFLFDSIAPGIENNIPQKLTRGQIFDLNVNITNENIRLQNFSVDQICYNGNTIVNTNKITMNDVSNSELLYEYNSRIELSDLFQTRCDFIITAKDYADNQVTQTISRDVDSHAPSVGIKSIEPLCENGVVSPLSSNLYQSQCSRVNVTIKLSNDVKETKYSIKYDGGTSRNLYDVYVNNLYDCDGTFKCFNFNLPLDVAQGLGRYTTITNTNFSIYANDGNPINYINKEYSVQYRDVDYSQPPQANLMFKDIYGNELDAISFGSYIIQIVSNARIYNKAIDLKFDGNNGQVEDVATIGANPNILSNTYEVRYYIDENSIVGQQINNSQGQVEITAHLEDALGLSSEVTKTIDFDMKNPIIELDPQLDDNYYSNKLVKYNDKYFTNSKNLTIGVKSSEVTDLKTSSISSLGIEKDYPNKTINTIDDSMLTLAIVPNSISENYVSVYGYINPYNYRYINFKMNNNIINDLNYPLRKTNFYIINTSNLGGGITRLELNNDASQLKGRVNSVSLGNNQFDNLYTNEVLNLDDGRNSVSINGLDYVNNPSNNIFLDITVDNQNGVITDYSPMGCVSSLENTISFELRDYNVMSPYSNIDLFVDDRKITTTQESQTTNNIIKYQVQGTKYLNQGQHTARVVARDYVGNTYEFKWIFQINEACNFDQNFSLNNGIKHGYGYITNQNNVDFKFKISNKNNLLNIDDYSINDNSIQIENLVDGTIKNAMITTSLNDELDGVIDNVDEGEYKININYNLTNNVNGQNLGPFENQYIIIIDNTAPEFDVNIPTYTYSGSSINVIAQLNNLNSLNYNSDLFDDFNVYNATFNFLGSSNNLVDHDNSNYILSYSVPQIASGTYPYSVTMTDLVGNSLTKSGSIYIDNNPPQFNILNYELENGKTYLLIDDSILTNSPTITISANLSDNVNKISYTRLDDNSNTFMDIPIYNNLGEKKISQTFNLNEGNNLYKIKIETTNDQTIHKNLKIILDSTAPELKDQGVTII